MTKDLLATTVKVLIAVALASSMISIRAGAQTFSSSNLPIIVIDTYGQPIPDAPKIDTQIGIIDDGEGARHSGTDGWYFYRLTAGNDVAAKKIVG